MIRKTPESFPRNALDQALIVFKGWKEMQNELNVPNLNLNAFEDKIKDAQRKVDKAEEMRQERTRVIGVRNKVLEEVWDLTKRIRNAAKATFGDDSKEIEKFGGKPVRFRKHYPPQDED